MTVGRVVATAPVRVCDVGGWTDTWFGSPGQVCSVAVEPGVTVTAERHVGAAVHGAHNVAVHLVAPDIGLDHWFGPAPDGAWSHPTPSVEPLLEHAVAQVIESAATRGAAPPADQAFTITISSAVPPGASLGTSAAVVVALMAALGALLEPDPGDEPDRPALARAAHLVETGRVGREAGVQDQWAAALGGALHLVIDTYPDTRARRIALPATARTGLGERLVTVVFGAHDSSAVHGEVIHALLSCDGVEHDRVRRETRALATLAGAAASALEAGDLDRWAEVLVASTEAQGRLHPGLVGPAHRRAIDLARQAGAVGWKVNGAGGDGGSLTVVAPPGGAATVREALAAGDPAWQVLDLTPTDQGMTVTRG